VGGIALPALRYVGRGAFFAGIDDAAGKQVLASAVEVAAVGKRFESVEECRIEMRLRPV
jgi:hypothetical protein